MRTVKTTDTARATYEAACTACDAAEKVYDAACDIALDITTYNAARVAYDTAYAAYDAARTAYNPGDDT